MLCWRNRGLTGEIGVALEKLGFCWRHRGCTEGTGVVLEKLGSPEETGVMLKKLELC